MNGWDNVEAGSVLFPLEGNGLESQEVSRDARKYTENSSYSASVSHWRVDKPVHNHDHCINCFFCWVYCPDSSIIAKEDQMHGIDYKHCKGCGVCVSVCPTNPKSLLMFNEYLDNDEAISVWPKKEDKK